MKKVLLGIVTLAALQNIMAQVKEGKIIYEQKVDMHRRIPEDNPQMKSMIPPTRIARAELQFADNQSLYKAIEEEPDITEQNQGGQVMIRIGAGGEDEYYKNFSTGRVVEKRELMQDLYLLEDSIRSLTWKLEAGETKNIAGLTCKKATGRTDRGNDVIAWYAEDIPVTSGPEQFNGLPGMILSLDINKGETVFTAISVEKKADKKMLKAPQKGKKVTGAEFAKIQEDLFGKEGRPVRIITN